VGAGLIYFPAGLIVAGALLLVDAATAGSAAPPHPANAEETNP
jgi:hypothetical protein